ncbi:MAG: HIT family protein [Helicobacteraceae bacterium]|nr:HIT family protein [Helicobacteraceae bacterium]
MFFKSKNLYIEWSEVTIPWLKIFTIEPYREITDCPSYAIDELWRTVLICEKTLREYYKPDKINIASFGNQLPRVHIHIMARFAADSHFPESMWGERQREGDLILPDRAVFETRLIAALTAANVCP